MIKKSNHSRANESNDLQKRNLLTLESRVTSINVGLNKCVNFFVYFVKKTKCSIIEKLPKIE